MLGLPARSRTSPRSAAISSPLSVVGAKAAPRLLDPRRCWVRARMAMPRLRSSCAERSMRTSSSKPLRISSPRMTSVTSAPERGEDAGELDRDVAAADDEDAARQRGQVERLVRRDGVLDAGNGRHDRVRAGGDHDVGGGVALALDLDRVRIDEPPARLDQLDAGIGEELAVDALRADRSRGSWRAIRLAQS